jgi:putative aldouronate transport system permease protein
MRCGKGNLVASRYIKTPLGGKLFDVANAAMLLFFALTIIYPFWNLILQSFSRIQDVSTLGMHIWIKRWTLDSWRFVFSDERLAIGYLNTLHRVVFGTLSTLLVTFTAAYALSKPNLPGRSFLTICFILTMFFSGGLIPTYLLIRTLGLMNSRWVLVIPSALNVYYIIITRNFLMTIDQAMEDSAIIDGAGYWTVLFRIMLPLSKPVLATIGLWAAVSHWNSWFDALIYIDEKDKQILQMLIRELLKTLDMAELDSVGLNLELEEFVPPQSVVAVTILVTIGPIVFVYPFIQKYFVKGVMLGSVKG